MGLGSQAKQQVGVGGQPSQGNCRGGDPLKIQAGFSGLSLSEEHFQGSLCPVSLPFDAGPQRGHIHYAKAPSGVIHVCMAANPHRA